ncbi:hypothetical protein [Ralstonia pseudosolanacearum]|uniref:hypothetical protein n=1 Tax=Ralstonia pseudosolanacearum TaxID=1310165 RepID=UPI003CEF2F9F
MAEPTSNQHPVPLSQALEAGTQDGITFGVASDATARAIQVLNNDLCRHVLVVDPNLAGKNALLDFALAQQVSRGGGAIVIESGQDNRTIDALTRFTRSCGRESDLLVINLFNPELSNSYNTILQGTPQKVASQVMSVLPTTEGNLGALLYRQKANESLTVLIAAIQKAGLAYNFLDLAMFLLKPSSLEALLERLLDSDRKSPEVSALSALLDSFRNAEGDIDHRRVAESMGGLAGRLYMYGTGGFGRVMNSYKPEVDLFTAVKENKLVYIAAPGTGIDSAAAALRKMLLMDLESALARFFTLPSAERKGDLPFMLIFGNSAEGDTTHVRRILEQSRAIGVSTWLCTKSLADLASVDRSLCDWAVGGTWSHAIFNLGDGEDATFFSSLTGNLLEPSDVGDTTARPVIEPAEFASLHTHECLLLEGVSVTGRCSVPVIDESTDVADKFSRERLTRIHSEQRDGADIFTCTSVMSGAH